MAGPLDPNASDPTLGGPGAISEINVTPFVDVVLVLLVIFMVTAPALLRDTIGIQLPKAQTSDRSAAESVGVAVNRDGVILLNGVPVTPDALRAEIEARLRANPETQAILSADQDTRHGDVVKAIDLIKSAGLKRFAIEIRKEKPTES